MAARPRSRWRYDLVVNTNGVSDGFRANVTWGDDVPPALSLPQFPISLFPRIVPPVPSSRTRSRRATPTSRTRPAGFYLATVLIERANRIRGVLACS